MLTNFMLENYPNIAPNCNEINSVFHICLGFVSFYWQDILEVRLLLVEFFLLLSHLLSFA